MCQHQKMWTYSFVRDCGRVYLWQLLEYMSCDLKGALRSVCSTGCSKVKSMQSFSWNVAVPFPLCSTVSVVFFFVLRAEFGHAQLKSQGWNFLQQTCQKWMPQNSVCLRPLSKTMMSFEHVGSSSFCGVVQVTTWSWQWRRLSCTNLTDSTQRWPIEIIFGDSLTSDYLRAGLALWWTHWDSSLLPCGTLVPRSKSQVQGHGGVKNIEVNKPKRNGLQPKTVSFFIPVALLLHPY